VHHNSGAPRHDVGWQGSPRNIERRWSVDDPPVHTKELLLGHLFTRSTVSKSSYGRPNLASADVSPHPRLSRTGLERVSPMPRRALMSYAFRCDRCARRVAAATKLRRRLGDRLGPVLRLHLTVWWLIAFSIDTKDRKYKRHRSRRSQDNRASLKRLQRAEATRL
jgi:hypothetical protein